MKLIVPKAICTAFSTYTSIPTPRIEWDSNATRLALGFFPLTGAVIGAVLFGWYLLSAALNIGDVLFAAVAVALPVLITGGIHLDGFCDTVDALSSRQERERKLEILKDPNTGAFAVIYCAVYLLLSFGLLHQSRESAAIIALGYTFSRALAAINAVTLPGARKNGMLASFTENAYKPAIIILSTLFGALSCVGMVVFNPRQGLITLALCALMVLWYRRMAIKEFGGATGDTSGFYLQLTELLILIGITAGGLA